MNRTPFADPWYQAIEALRFAWTPASSPLAPSTPEPSMTMPSAGPRARDWCFTMNNPEESGSDLSERFSMSSKCKYAVWQLERGEEGTPHFQGYVEFSNTATLAATKKMLPTAHWEVRKGSRPQARAYAMKEDTREDGPWEFGTWSEPSGPGARSDLDLVRDEILSGVKTRRDILMDYPSVLAKYPRFVDTCFSEYVKSSANKIEDFEPRTWQSKIIQMVEGSPDERQVLWVYDPVGNTGKTYMAKYLVQEYSAFYCNGGKSTDLLYAYSGEKIAIFDYVRDSEAYVGYGPIEQIKNGILFSSKYESGQKVFSVPHVIIFANFTPDKSKMSADRWVIVEVKADGDWVNHT